MLCEYCGNALSDDETRCSSCNLLKGRGWIAKTHGYGHWLFNRLDNLECYTSDGVLISIGMKVDRKNHPLTTYFSNDIWVVRAFYWKDESCGVVVEQITKEHKCYFWEFPIDKDNVVAHAYLWADKSNYKPIDESVTGRSAVHQKCDIEPERIASIPTYDSNKSLIIPRHGHIIADYFATCEVCGTEYRTSRKHTRTCSPACRKRLSRMGASKV